MLVSFGRLFAVTLCGLRHKDHGQHTEYKCLDDTHEQFKHHNHRGQNGNLSKQTGNDRDQYDPCKHISEKTEGKREDFGKLRDQLEQAHKKVHRAEKWHLEHSARVEELAQISSSLRTETDILNCNHGNQCQRGGEVQIYGDPAEERSQNIPVLNFAWHENATGGRVARRDVM